MSNVDDLITELQSLNQKLEQMTQNQQDLKKEIRMIFADITHFENLVLKVLDHKIYDFPKEKYHH